MIKYIENNDLKVEIGGCRVGEIIKEDQTYYFNVENPEYWSAENLRQIANKLDELNGEKDET